MSEPTKVICPDCGAVMNHHAVKVDYGVDESELNSIFAGALKEVHTCPKCGRAEMRAAA